MEEIIWVEVLSRHRDVVARHRCVGPVVRIGRDYANDVVIDDPYVAPRHVRVMRDGAGVLVAEDLGSANGLFGERGSRRLGRVVLDGERLIRIGQSLLRIRDASHAVAPERLYASQTRLWPVLVILAAAVIAIEAGMTWLGETAEPRMNAYLAPVQYISLFVIGWTVAWSVLSRVFSGRARFERNLLIALGGLLVFSLFDELVKASGYVLSWRDLTAYEYVGTWSVVAVVCFLHLRELGPTRLMLKGGIVTALLAVAIGMHILGQSEIRTVFDQQSYVRHLLPPALRLAAVRSETSFFADVAQLKGKLDRDRKEDLPAGASAAAGSDD
jgi:FHA domain